MVFKPSAVLREPSRPPSFASGDSVFRLFLGLAVVVCVWSTVVQPRLPALSDWVQRLVGS